MIFFFVRRIKSWTEAPPVSSAGQCHEPAPLPTRGGAAALAHWQPVLRGNSQAILLLSSDGRFLELNVEYEWNVFLFAGFHCTRPCSLVSDNALLSGWLWCCCQGLWWRVRPRSRSLSISTCVCIFVPVWLHFPQCIFLCWWDPHISNHVSSNSFKWILSFYQCCSRADRSHLQVLEIWTVIWCCDHFPCLVKM